MSSCREPGGIQQLMSTEAAVVWEGAQLRERLLARETLSLLLPKDTDGTVVVERMIRQKFGVQDNGP